MRKSVCFLLQPPRGGYRAGSRQRRVAVSCMRTAWQSTNVLFLSSFIDTVLMLGFSNLKKRHPVGQRRVAVLRGETVPVPPIARVSITKSVRMLCSILALIGHRMTRPGGIYVTAIVRTTPGAGVPHGIDLPDTTVAKRRRRCPVPAACGLRWVASGLQQFALQPLRPVHLQQLGRPGQFVSYVLAWWLAGTPQLKIAKSIVSPVAVAVVDIFVWV